jgi:hypothetical protein
MSFQFRFQVCLFTSTLIKWEVAIRRLLGYFSQIRSKCWNQFAKEGM